MTEEFSQRFQNWVRWCSVRGVYQGHAFSIEGLYRSPQHWHPEDPRPPEIDRPDAVMVNRAYTRLAILTPRQARIIKFLTFRAYLRPQWQAQKLGIHYLELDEAYYRAKLMLEHQLARVEGLVYKGVTAHPVPASRL